MADYDPIFKTLSKQYIRACMEYKDATAIVTKEFKQLRDHVKHQKEAVQQLFDKYMWPCVYDRATKTYVVRTRQNPKPLTVELMNHILAKVHALYIAKKSTWRTVKEAVDEVVGLMYRMRMSEDYGIVLKPKPPTASTKLVFLSTLPSAHQAILAKYMKWYTSLKTREATISKRKKILKSRVDELESQITPYYESNHYISVPVKFDRKITSEFQELVTITGSDFLNHRLPRKTKRYLEYVPVPCRNTEVKKFVLNKRNAFAYLMNATRSYKSPTEFDIAELTKQLFQHIQDAAHKANKEKLQKAKTHPKYVLKVAQKKTPKRKVHDHPINSSNSSNLSRFKRVKT